LAHLGEYDAAIAAYDQALAMEPAMQDAVVNRELVEKMKEQKEQEQQQQEGEQGDSKDGESSSEQQEGVQDGEQQEGEQEGEQQRNHHGIPVDPPTASRLVEAEEKHRQGRPAVTVVEHGKGDSAAADNNMNALTISPAASIEPTKPPRSFRPASGSA